MQGCNFEGRILGEEGRGGGKEAADGALVEGVPDGEVALGGVDEDGGY